MPPSRGPDPPQPKGQAAAPEQQQHRPVAPVDLLKPKAAATDGRGSRLRRHLPIETRQTHSRRTGRSSYVYSDLVGYQTSDIRL